MSQISIDDFRTEALGFLEANAQRRGTVAEFEWGEGNDDVGLFEERDHESELVETS